LAVATILSIEYGNLIYPDQLGKKLLLLLKIFITHEDATDQSRRRKSAAAKWKAHQGQV